jgi:hypothetical protein
LFGQEEGREHDYRIELEQHTKGQSDIGRTPAPALGGQEAEQCAGGWQEVEALLKDACGAEQEIEYEDRRGPVSLGMNQ